MTMRIQVSKEIPFLCRQIAEKMEGEKLTISLSTGWRGSLANFTLVLQVEVPAVGLALVVCEVEGEDSTAILDGVLALSVVGLEDGVDLVEGDGGGKRVYWRYVSVIAMRMKDTGVVARGWWVVKGRTNCS